MTIYMFTNPELEIIKFNVADVVTSSTTEEEDVGPGPAAPGVGYCF